MMKTAKVLLVIGVLLGCTHWAQAQVKIGDRPLEIGDERLLEMEKAGELFIVTDSLEIGITNSTTTNDPSTDAMMLKLYGYGLGQFQDDQSYFLGTNTLGEVLEFPITLDLVTNSTTAQLALFNGTSNFTTVDLTDLDSVFTTDNNLSDSLDIIRTLLNDLSMDVDSDLDTIQTNELIDEIFLIDDPLDTDPEQSLLEFYEDVYIGDDNLRHRSSINLTFGMASDFELQQVLDSIFYNNDGSLTSDRTVTGAGNSLTFTDVSAFDVNSTGNTTVTSGGNTTVTTTGNTDVTTTGTTSIGSDGTVSITSVNDDITIDASGDSISMVGVVRLDEYPAIPPTSMFNNILGIDANGNVVNVTASDILGTDADSVIYRHDGSLTSQRYMTMNSFDLHFVGPTDTTVIARDGRVAVGTATFTPNSTGANASDVKLEVAGDILARRVHSSSDERFKKNIKKIDSALDKVLQINGVTYDWRTEEFKQKNFSESRQVGFIAQNVEQVLPEVVQTYGDGYKAVDYAKVTALLNEAIKEQQELIQQQSKLIAAQRDALSNLSAEVMSIRSQLTQLTNDGEDTQRTSSISEE